MFSESNRLLVPTSRHQNNHSIWLWILLSSFTKLYEKLGTCRAEQQAPDPSERHGVYLVKYSIEATHQAVVRTSTYKRTGPPVDGNCMCRWMAIQIRKFLKRYCICHRFILLIAVRLRYSDCPLPQPYAWLPSKVADNQHLPVNPRILQTIQCGHPKTH